MPACVGPLGRRKQEATEDETDAHRRGHEGHRVAPGKAFEIAGQLVPRAVPNRVGEPGNLVGGLVRVLHQPTGAGRFERLRGAPQRIAESGDLIGGARALGVDQRHRAVARRADQLRADLFGVAHRVPAQFDMVARRRDCRLGCPAADLGSVGPESAGPESAGSADPEPAAAPAAGTAASAPGSRPGLQLSSSRRPTGSGSSLPRRA